MSQMVAVPSLGERSEPKIDSIARGLSFMLVANILQRGVGFVRGLVICAVLSEQQLGLWALASSFFLLAAPFAVLGLPGSLSRFVEFYRVRHQLNGYLYQITLGAMLGTFLMAFGLIVLTPWSSRWVLGQSHSWMTMSLLSLTLVSVVAFNFLNELASSFRQPRLASSMQMVNSLSFTFLCLVSLLFFRDWRAVLGAFAFASVLGTVPAWLWLRKNYSHLAVSQQELCYQSMWQRILPYAVSIWVWNLLSNLFDVIDRYMLLHCSRATVEVGQAMVGEYHSGRMLPLLLASLGLMINGMLLPYLSADWESRRIEQVKRSLRTYYCFLMLFFWSLSVAGILVAPWLFDQLLQGRYREGVAIIPTAMLHCTLIAGMMLLQNYFWCAERGRVVSGILVVGLILNIVLNGLLVPTQGTQGAMTATMVSAAMMLAMTIVGLYQEGCRLGKQGLILTLLPFTMLLSPWLSVGVIAVCGLLILQTDWILSEPDKRLLLARLPARFVRG